MRRRVFVLFIALSILVEPSAGWSENEEYLSTFEIVWNKVNETYFDTTFSGLDWSEVHDRFQPRIAAAKSDKEFYKLINNMLWELKVSHANLLPPGSFALYEPLVFAKGSPGIDIRMVNGAAVITSVKTESPAHEAGLCPGYVIQAFDGISVEQIVRETELRTPPPANRRSRNARITKAILSRIYGAPGTKVSIVYSDKAGKEKEKKILRAKRSGVAIGPKGIFFLVIEFEARRLNSGIGYIRLNTFLPPLATKISDAIKSMGNVCGIIFDLRGNSGGEIENMPDLFLKERSFLYLRKYW